MARGWESKAVESQIEQAEERLSQAKALRVSEAEISLQREREGLELSRTRILQELAKASKPGYREILERSLGFLDEKLAALPPKAKSHHA
jgi:hypothetical protein